MRAPLQFLNPSQSLPMPSKSRHTRTKLVASLLQRFRASAGDVGMSVLLACVVLGFPCWGLLAWPWLAGGDEFLQLGPDQNAVPMPRSWGPAPLSPLLPLPDRQLDRCQGAGKESGIVINAGAASPGAYRPLTDLDKCSSGEGAQGTPHSCAALAPMLVEMHRSIG